MFVDLEKAYDKVPRDLVWKVLRKKVVSGRHIEAVKDMHRGRQPV